MVTLVRSRWTCAMCVRVGGPDQDSTGSPVRSGDRRSTTYRMEFKTSGPMGVGPGWAMGSLRHQTPGGGRFVIGNASMRRVAFDSPGSLFAPPSLTPRSGGDDSPTCCGRWTGVTLRITDVASGADREDPPKPGENLPRIGENGRVKGGRVRSPGGPRGMRRSAPRGGGETSGRREAAPFDRGDGGRSGRPTLSHEGQARVVRPPRQPGR